MSGIWEIKLILNSFFLTFKSRKFVTNRSRSLSISPDSKGGGHGITSILEEGTCINSVLMLMTLL